MAIDESPSGAVEVTRDLESVPHQGMGTAEGYCRYSKAQLTPYSGAITVAGMDPTGTYQIFSLSPLSLSLPGHSDGNLCKRGAPKKTPL